MNEQTSALLLFQIMAVVVAPVPHLIYVHIIWRHGDRAPLAAYPNDAYQERHWHNGFGELTERGLRQQFALGRALRERYVNRSPPFLSRHRHYKEIYIRSTDSNRTIMSALATIAGMFPNGEPGKDFPHPNKESSWPYGWTPVPVHTVDLKYDYAANPFRRCERASELEYNAFHSDDYLEMKDGYRDFLDDLSNKTGSRINIDRGIIYEYDCHVIEKLHNLTQPSWFTDEIAEHLRVLQRSVLEYRYGIAKYFRNNVELQRLRGGAILGSVVAKLSAKWRCLYGEEDQCIWYHSLKFDALSAHDITLNALFIALGCEAEVLGKPPNIDYGSNVAFELYRIGSKPFVKVLYSRSFASKPEVVTLLVRGCSSTGDYCPLSEFVSAQQPFVPVDIEKECNRKRENNDKCG